MGSTTVTARLPDTTRRLAELAAQEAGESLSRFAARALRRRALEELAERTERDEPMRAGRAA